MIGTIPNSNAFPDERKYRCIIHNTCSDYPCIPCSIQIELQKDNACPTDERKCDV
jgi:hypothetical protein